MNSSAVQRYVPLVAWITVLALGLCIGLKIIGYGFLPSGDARRHVAKAVIDKDYREIVVLRPEYKIDHSPGWDWILRHMHQWLGLDEDGLIAFSVVTLLGCIFFVGLPWLRRPEAWFAALLAQLIAIPEMMVRLTQGRPFLLTETVLITILFAWSRNRGVRPSWQKLVLTVIGFGLSAWVHGGWYLWPVVFVAFFMAGAWRESFWLAGCWMVGTVAGALLTGQPVAFLYEEIFMAASVYKEHAPPWMLVGEFQPSEGEFKTVALLALIYLWRREHVSRAGGLLRQPVFWMAAIGWALGLKADRCWADWGLPAGLVWMATQFDEAMAEFCPMDSIKRLLVCGLIAVPMFFDTTSDLMVRYTFSFQESFVDATKPELKGWMPEGDGIFYNPDMAFFYNTFYKNPHGTWRYILAFEPALMPEDDLKIYRAIQWAHFSFESYAPWIKKMRQQDRLAVQNSGRPSIPELEWQLAARGLWIGRKPAPTEPEPAVKK